MAYAPRRSEIRKLVAIYFIKRVCAALGSLANVFPTFATFIRWFQFHSLSFSLSTTLYLSLPDYKNICKM